MDPPIASSTTNSSTYQPYPKHEGAILDLNCPPRSRRPNQLFAAIFSRKSDFSLPSTSLHRNGATTFSFIRPSGFRKLIPPLILFHRGKSETTEPLETPLPSPMSSVELASCTDIEDKDELGLSPTLLHPPNLISIETAASPLLSGPPHTSDLCQRLSQHECIHNCPRAPRHSANFGNLSCYTSAEDGASTTSFGPEHQEILLDGFDGVDSSSINSTHISRRQRARNDPSDPSSDVRYACPLSKRRPERYDQVDCACTSRFGFSEVKKVTEHVKEVHLHNWKNRCGCGSNGRTNPDCLDYTSKTRDMTQPEFLTPEQEEAIYAYRAVRGAEPTQQWLTLYSKLHPEVEYLPDPEYDYLVTKFSVDKTIESLNQTMESLNQTIESLEGRLDRAQRFQEHTYANPRDPSSLRQIIGIPSADHFTNFRPTNMSPICYSNATSSDGQALPPSNALSPRSPDPASLQVGQRQRIPNSDYETASHPESYEVLTRTPDYRSGTEPERTQPAPVESFSQETYGIGQTFDQTFFPQQYSDEFNYPYH